MEAARRVAVLLSYTTTSYANDPTYAHDLVPDLMNSKTMTGWTDTKKRATIVCAVCTDRLRLLSQSNWFLYISAL